VPHPWFPKGGSWVSFNRKLQRRSLRPNRLHLPLNLRSLPRPPLALQIIKIPQLQPESRIRLEIPRRPERGFTVTFAVICRGSRRRGHDLSCPYTRGGLRLGFGGFLLHALFGPGRNDAILAGIRYGLAEMFAKMSGDEKEGAANGGVLAKHFLRVVQVRIFDGKNRAPEVREGVFESLKGHGFIASGGVDGFGVDACGQRGAERAGNAVIGGGDVRVNFADRADAFRGAPGIFFGGNGFGEAGVALLIVGDFGEEFAARAGDSGSSSGRLVLSGGAVGKKRYGGKCKKNDESKTSHGSLQRLVRGKRRGFYNRTAGRGARRRRNPSRMRERTEKRARSIVPLHLGLSGYGKRREWNWREAGRCSAK
jgi:hypothetical protein